MKFAKNLFCLYKKYRQYYSKTWESSSVLFSMMFLYVAGVIFIYHAVVQFVNGTVYIMFHVCNHELTLLISANHKATCKCTGFIHCTSSQHVELNKLSTFEHPVEQCWVLLSQIWNWSNFSLNTAQHFLCFAVIHVWLNKVECICTATLNMLSPRKRSDQRIHW